MIFESKKKQKDEFESERLSRCDSLFGKGNYWVYIKLGKTSFLSTFINYTALYNSLTNWLNSRCHYFYILASLVALLKSFLLGQGSLMQIFFQFTETKFSPSIIIKKFCLYFIRRS